MCSSGQRRPRGAWFLGYVGASVGVVGAVLGAAAVLATPARAAVTPVKWCGTDAVALDRPDEVPTHVVRIVYAIPSDGVDRFPSAADGIATDLAVVGAWWKREDPSHEPRFDMFPFPGCASPFGMLDLATVRLSGSAGFYEGDGGFSGQAGRIAAGVAAALPGAPAFKKYLVYYDAPIATTACGASQLLPEAAGAASSAIVFLQAALAGNRTCGALGEGAWLAGTAAHELTHNLGAVPVGAPNMCRESGHVCDNPLDNMYAGTGRRPLLLMDRQLDPGRDDYYGHSGSWWDVQDSLWLNRIGTPQSALDVTVVGGGRVYSAPPGIDCRAACRFLYNASAAITLYAQPDAGMRLRTWQGACSGSAPTCPLSTLDDSSVVARFAPPNTGPTAAFELLSTQRITAPLALTSTSSDPDGEITAQVWDFGDGVTKAGASVSHTYANAGTYRVRLTVTDDEAATAWLERTITITVNEPPTAAFALSASRQPIAAAVIATSSSRDADGSVATLAWDFGDGHTLAGETVSHRYASPGVYRVRLTVTDNEGGTSSTEQSVTVIDSAPTASASRRAVRAGARARLSFRARDDVAVERIRVTVRRGSRLLARREAQIGSATVLRVVSWRTPRSPATYRWCVQAWDSRGQASRLSCASLVAR